METERTTTLEERYTHLEHKVEQLSEVVYAQGHELNMLREVLERLRDRLFAGDSGMVDAPHDEKPPHY
jgi:uncharacterized coiled-coil protein SlyX